jgi:uncharacterized protein YndB with AHSA1/START domain
MPDRVLVEVLVAAPIDTVWKALRDPKEICRWFGWDYPDLAKDVEMMFGGMIEDVANRTLSSKHFPDRFALEDAGSHTVVRIIRSAPVTDGGWQGIYDDVHDGWIMFLQQLKFTLERHAGEERRTIHLNGRAKDAATPLPVAALGFGRLAAVPTGERYEIDTPTGDTLSGVVYYRSADQLGLTVDQCGNGLLIVTTRPRTAKSPFGGGQIVITTYGMHEAAFKAGHQRWADWWTRTYEVIEIH